MGQLVRFGEPASEHHPRRKAQRQQVAREAQGRAMTMEQAIDYALLDQR